MITVEELKRRLERYKNMKAELESLHKGNEPKFTYWGGYSLGEVNGKISVIEQWIDEIEGKLVIPAVPESERANRDRD